jgi:hypothetical protein
VLKKHDQRAVDFRRLAVGARDKSRLTALPRVREMHEQAAARWDALAELEELFVRRTAERRDAAAQVAG